MSTNGKWSTTSIYTALLSSTMNTLLLPLAVLKNKCAAYSEQHSTLNASYSCWIYMCIFFRFFSCYFLGLMLTSWPCMNVYMFVCRCETEHIRYSLARLPLFLICFHTHLSVQVVGNKPVYIIATAFRVLIMHRVIFFSLVIAIVVGYERNGVCPSLFLGYDFTLAALFLP